MQFGEEQALVKNSIQYKYYRYNAVLFLIFMIIFCLPLLIGIIASGENGLIIAIVTFPLFACFIIPLFYYMYRLRWMLKNAMNFVFKQVTLDKVITSPLLRTAGFEVDVIGEGNKKMVTSRIFTITTVKNLNIQNYINKEALVAYLPNTDHCFVIKTFDQKRSAYERY